MNGRCFRVLFACVVVVATSGLTAVASAGEPSLVPRNPLKLLLLDGRVVATSEGVQLVPGKLEKDPHNPLFRADKPWESSLNNLYPNVTFDADAKLFKLWYKCALVEKESIAKMMPPATIHNVGWFLLYATSKDGVAWEKPDLGIHGFDGSTKNNVVARDTANVGVMRDPHDPDPARRYKMIYDVGFSKIRVRFSPDGIHWTEPIEPKGLGQPEGGGRTGDTHNNAFWDERLGKYVLSTRIYRGERLVARSESDDFLNWQQPKLVLRSSAAEGKSSQTYCMTPFPYANGYLGYVMMYHVKPDHAVDSELVWSPDGIRWQRVCPGKPFVPRGPQGSYDSKCIYSSAGPAIAQDGKLLIFYGGSEIAHLGWKRHCLPCLARLRMDGFAGYEPIQAGGLGTVVTQPMLATGEPLRISADAQGGSLRVSVLDTAGCALDDCEPIATDVTDGAVQWKGHKGLESFKGKTVRLKFELRGAKLYALSGASLIEPAKKP